ncbi:MAG: hypothetical protein ACKVT0_18115 [Planctomycetaceae bacterium]
MAAGIFSPGLPGWHALCQLHRLNRISRFGIYKSGPFQYSGVVGKSVLARISGWPCSTSGQALMEMDGSSFTQGAGSVRFTENQNGGDIGLRAARKACRYGFHGLPRFVNARLNFFRQRRELPVGKMELHIGNVYRVRQLVG